MLDIRLRGDSLLAVEDLATKRGITVGEVIADAIGMYSYLARRQLRMPSGSNQKRWRPRSHRRPEPEQPQLPRYDMLIPQIQNRKGHVVSREGELACQELIETFRYLIQKISSQTWRKESGERRDD